MWFLPVLFFISSESSRENMVRKCDWYWVHKDSHVYELMYTHCWWVDQEKNTSDPVDEYQYLLPDPPSVTYFWDT
jgi:hypothetical protein